MTNQKELQEKIMTFRVLQSKLENLIKQRDFLSNKLFEIENTLESIKDLLGSKDKTLFSLGSEAYIFGKVENMEKMILEIGAGIAVEKNIDEGKEILNKRKEEMDKIMLDIQREIGRASSLMEQLSPEIENLMGSQQAD